jgi:integrase
VAVETPDKPSVPFRPRSFSVTGPIRETSATRPKGPIYGADLVGPDGEALLDGHGRPVREFLGWKQPGKTRTCWDLTITCDGHRWYDRHYAAGRAQTARDELEEGFRQLLDFDPETRRFLPVDHQADDAPSVFSETISWWRSHWSTIEPKSRMETMRYIARPVIELVRPGAAPPGLQEYLTWQLLPPKPLGAPIPDEHAAAAAWLNSASLPVQDADITAWQAYADRWRINTRTGRPLAQSSYNRHLADVRQLWAWVCAVHQLPNPWPMVKSGARSSVGGRRGTTVKPVDRTIVLAPDHVRELGHLCGERSFGPLAEVYVLLLGIAGGRPGESAGVQTNELDTPSSRMGEVLFRRTTRRGIDSSFLDLDDDPAWGPLKGREIEEERNVPLPSRDTKRIRQLVNQSRIAGPLFHDWDWEKFSRDVWAPAKVEMASRHAYRSETAKVSRQETEALLSALGRLRLHDLRHAACSMWLNTPGIEVRVACEWSGHKRLSVFLDIYQGLMPGSQASAKAKLDAAWGI